MCLAFLHTAEFLKDKIKKLYCILKKGVLACILALITSLLKSWELDQYFKNNKKNLFCFLLILRITHLYVRRILNIKKVILLLTLEQFGLIW